MRHQDHSAMLIIQPDVDRALQSTIINFSHKNGEYDERVDKKFVHKRNDNNVVISRPFQINKGEKLVYRMKIIPDLADAFFFDHPLAHYPGMLILEAARQSGTAISHFFYNVKSGSQFILNEFDSIFLDNAPIDVEVYIDGIIVEALLKGGFLRRIRGVGYVHALHKVIAKIYSSWTVLPQELMMRMKFH